MNIIIHGRDVTAEILTMTRWQVESLYAILIDKAPLCEESTAHWQQRNSNLLKAMLALNCNSESQTKHDAAIATKSAVTSTERITDDALSDIDKELENLTACDREALIASIEDKLNLEAIDSQMVDTFYY